jgi:hypothetical protein
MQGCVHEKIDDSFAEPTVARLRSHTPMSVTVIDREMDPERVASTPSFQLRADLG